VPKQMLTLNDFSGGLNTKSSPRDIAFNQVQLANNVVLSNPGLIESSSDSSTQSYGTISRVSTSNYGNGGFIFNHEFDISDSSAPITQTAKEIIAYPDNTDLKFLHRLFQGGTVNLEVASEADSKFQGTDANSITMSDGTFEPVYYFVDGVLHIADKDRVDTSGSFTQKSLQLVDKDRFGVTLNSEWVGGDSGPTATTDAIFEAIENESTVSVSTASAAGEFRLGFNSNPTQSSLSAFQGGLEDVKLTVAVEEIGTQITVSTDSGVANISSLFPVDTYIYLGNEIMRVNYAPIGTTSLLIPVTRGVFGTTPGEHSIGDVLEKSTEEPVGTGSWPEGIYEFTYSIIDYSGNETLPHTFSTALDTATIAEGQFFEDVDVKFNTESAFRKNEKGVRVYTRIKDSNERFILFLDIDYERGVRRNLFEEFSSWNSSSTYGSAGNTAYLQNQLRILNPSLDTYESINGYAQEEDSINLGTKGGYKAAAVCARRAWIANVRKNDLVFDDRIYYSPVNKFATFPDSYFLDIGINDGDSFSALHSLGNRLLAFKQKKLYVINVSSTSDAGWYLEAEYNGVGCFTQESVVSTPFGVCWINQDGVYIFDGSSPPRELSSLLNDKTFRSNSVKRGAVGYNSRHKQLVVCQNTSATNELLIYDFPSQAWSVTQSMNNGMSNFMQTSQGLYFIQYASSGDNKTVEFLSGNPGTNQIDLKTKDIDFGSPGKVKKVYKVYITAKDDGQAGNGNTLTLKYALNGSATFGNATTATPQDNLGEFDTLVYTLGVDCESIAFELTDESASETISINDITIEYREKYKRAS
jgi:hypothetical protein